MNAFQYDYETRLQQWNQLRSSVHDLTTLDKCTQIDDFWQNVPLVNHHLHISDTKNWPDPWELLVENTYCTVARALGMCYTLLLVGINDIQMVEATDMNCEDVILVLVENAKYILNYWPKTVVNNSSNDFVVKRVVDLYNIKQKLK
jgi:hypothetical protein